MSQSHLVIDFPIEKPESAKALAEELPPLMPDFAKAQDSLGTVHFSRFMVEGDEKLLFISDIDGEVDEHIEQLVANAGPVFDAILKHVDDPPSTPAATNPERVTKWLKHRVREPLDTYFAYEDASVQDIKECASAAGFAGDMQQGWLLTYMPIKSRRAGLCPEAGGEALSGRQGTSKRRILSGRCISPIGCPSSGTILLSLRSMTALSRSTSRTSPTRPPSSSMLSFRMLRAGRQPQ